MTEVETRLLPHAATWAGLREPMNMHLVLTGPRPAAIAIVTDAAGSCRLAATGAFPAELDLRISADPGRAARMLAAASGTRARLTTDSPAG